MVKQGRGIEILREEGFQSLIERSADYYSRFLFRKYYEYKSIFLNNIVSINGIKINTDQKKISDDMLDRLRSREYENEVASMIRSYLYNDLPVIELGGGIGYTSCLVDDVCDNEVTTVTLEANENLIPLIKETRRINDADFEIYHKAYSAKKEEIELTLASDFWSSSQYDREITEEDRVIVNATNIEEITRESNIHGNFQLIVDIEGGEHDLLLNEMDILKSNCKLLIVEFHSFTEYDLGEYIELLESNGFEVIESEGVESPGPDSIFVFENRGIK